MADYAAGRGFIDAEDILTLRSFCGSKDQFSAMANAFVAAFVAEIAALRTPTD